MALKVHAPAGQCNVRTGRRGDSLLELVPGPRRLPARSVIVSALERTARERVPLRLGNLYFFFGKLETLRPVGGSPGGELAEQHVGGDLTTTIAIAVSARLLAPTAGTTHAARTHRPLLHHHHLLLLAGVLLFVHLGEAS